MQHHDFDIAQAIGAGQPVDQSVAHDPIPVDLVDDDVIEEDDTPEELAMYTNLDDTTITGTDVPTEDNSTAIVEATTSYRITKDTVCCVWPFQPPWYGRLHGHLQRLQVVHRGC